MVTYNIVFSEGAETEQNLLWGVEELFWGDDALFWPLRSDTPASTGIFGSFLVENLEASLLWGADELYWGSDALFWARVADVPASTGVFVCLLSDVLAAADDALGVRNVFGTVDDLLNIIEINTAAFVPRINYADPELMCVRYEPRFLRINAERFAAVGGENRAAGALPVPKGDAEPRKRTC